MATSIFALDLAITVIFMVLSGAWANAWRTVGAGVILLLAFNWTISAGCSRRSRNICEGKRRFDVDPAPADPAAAAVRGPRRHHGLRRLVVPAVDCRGGPTPRMPAADHRRLHRHRPGADDLLFHLHLLRGQRLSRHPLQLHLRALRREPRPVLRQLPAEAPGRAAGDLDRRRSPPSWPSSIPTRATGCISRSWSTSPRR